MQLSTNDVLNKKIGFISLGCDKNRVDLENIMATIVGAGFTTTTNLEQADVVVVNTCSFIQSAREESIDAILNSAQLKHIKLEKLIVTGCLNHMDYSDLDTSLPEVDLFVKVSDNKNIVKSIFDLYNVEQLPQAPDFKYSRVLSTPSHYAYLKISEGCNNFCSYCTIPFIRGNFVSQPMELLIDEAKELVKQGVKEIILVGQDVTKYGLDLYDKLSLPKLIQELSKIKNLKWIRLLYCYPELITQELANEIANNDKVVKYIDMPMQHINDDILKAMNRRSNKDKITSVVDMLRQATPDIAIRTTFILGFPGETQSQFNDVLSFLSQYKLSNVGFFAYSKEEGTKAYSFKNHISQKIKDSRVEQAYITQQNVVSEINQSLISKVIDVIVDNKSDGGFVGRAYFSAPEIDTVVYIKDNNKIKIGDIIKVKITTILDYDLEGEYYELTK